MRLALAVLLAFAASPALAATCSPISSSARILASPDYEDIHPDWSDGSRIGLSWTLDLIGEEQGEDGDYYLIGDLIDPSGDVVTESVFVSEMEWECDAD